MNHGRFKLANRAGNDLLHGSPAARETSHIIFGGEVSHQRRDSAAQLKKSQRFLGKSGLARSWAGYETDR